MAPSYTGLVYLLGMLHRSVGKNIAIESRDLNPVSVTYTTHIGVFIGRGATEAEAETNALYGLKVSMRAEYDKKTAEAAVAKAEYERVELSARRCSGCGAGIVMGKPRVAGGDEVRPLRYACSCTSEALTDPTEWEPVNPIMLAAEAPTV